VVLQLVKLGNIFKLSALPSASEEKKKKVFSLSFLPKQVPP